MVGNCRWIVCRLIDVVERSLMASEMLNLILLGRVRVARSFGRE